jgi:hypothetical protein
LEWAKERAVLQACGGHVDDNRVSGNFGPVGTLYCIPQQGSSEFQAMIGESDGQASQSGDGNRRIAWQTFRQSGWHLREKNPTRRQCLEPSNPIRHDLAGHEARSRAAAYILAGLLPKIAIERNHTTRILRMIVARCKRLNDEPARHREDAIKRA